MEYSDFDNVTCLTTYHPLLIIFHLTTRAAVLRSECNWRDEDTLAPPTKRTLESIGRSEHLTAHTCSTASEL
ncbi:hypothetical protein AGOR_G00047660 [Albula goreensis]|uniref:Uncharacterized protein n=1 Tax=Albula goreensis TaxID=1534307 RepID=A0A8T3DV15_9TELE|nr:hypothetical protein AGOR_G00047660 [Albula goreensis]